MLYKQPPQLPNSQWDAAQYTYGAAGVVKPPLYFGTKVEEVVAPVGIRSHVLSLAGYDITCSTLSQLLGSVCNIETLSPVARLSLL